MTPHFAITLAELFAIAGMIVFFLFFLPRTAFAGAAGSRPTPAPAGMHHALSPPATRAIMQDRRNSRNLLYRAIDLLVKATGRCRYSYPAALFFISLIVRLAFLPWSIRQFRDAQTLRALEPETHRLQEECKKDPHRLAAAISELYKKHGIDPRLTALFAIIQGAVFMALYYMVTLYQYRFAHGGFLWIGSGLAHRYPKWIAASLASPDLPLVTLYGLSIYFAPLISASANLENSCMRKATTFISAIFLAGLVWIRHTPSAFALYWLISNCLTLLVQALAARWSKPAQKEQPA